MQKPPNSIRNPELAKARHRAISLAFDTGVQCAAVLWEDGSVTACQANEISLNSRIPYFVEYWNSDGSGVDPWYPDPNNEPRCMHGRRSSDMCERCHAT